MSRPRTGCGAMFRCYAPSVVGAVILGVLLGYSLWLAQGEDLRRIKFRQVLDGFLILFFLGPVVLGTLRGFRRRLQHMSRPH